MSTPPTLLMGYGTPFLTKTLTFSVDVSTSTEMAYYVLMCC